MFEKPAAEMLEPVVKDLTDQQRSELTDFAAQWHHSERQEIIDREGVRAAIGRLYKMARVESAPAVIFSESPWQMAVMHAMIVLLSIGADTTLRQDLPKQLLDPMWQRAWQQLAEQMKDLQLPTFDGKAVASGELFGFDTGTNIRVPVIGKICEAYQKLEGQLSLRVKLKLREVFLNHADDDRNDVRMGRTPLLRGQFGLMPLQSLVGAGLRQQFLNQLDPQMQQVVFDLCKERFASGQVGMFGLTTRAREPGEDLFISLSEQLNSPAAMAELEPLSFVLKQLPVTVEEEISEPIMDWLLIKENVFNLSCRERLCLVCEAPTTTVLNLRDQLHNEHGPALEFRDGAKVYAWNGVVVPGNAIAPSQSTPITIAQIDAEQNIEVRRILIQQYGMEKYLEDSGAVELDADDCGVLYRKILPNDEPILVVRVLNQTLEPDGSRKVYFLRVPPHVTSARAAVAWTFAMTKEEYQPAAQA